MEINPENFREAQEAQGPFRADKVIFLFCMLTCCAAGFLFHKFCNISKCSPKARYSISCSIGLVIVFISYGFRCCHLLIVSSLVYIILKLFSPKRAFWLSFILSLTYSSWAHLYRMQFDYGGYSADVSLPLMVLVQRLTLLAANIWDGQVLKSEEAEKKKTDNSENETHKSKESGQLTPTCKQYAILEIPNPLEFFSYCLNFLTILAGPPMTFRDYRTFIEGREAEDKSLTPKQRAYFMKNRDTILQPRNEMLKYALQAALYLLVYLSICQFFLPSFYLSETFKNFGFFHKCVYLIFTGFTMRQHYYFAWSLCALGCLAAGFGFDGFDQNDKPTFKLVNSFNFKKAEFPRSVKELTDNWNLQTLLWLRITVFDRVPRGIGVFAVFFVSVLWHGFYPGYYLFFVSMAWYSSIGRRFRKHVRPCILEWLPDTKWVWTKANQREGTSHIYDAITHIVTYFLVNYTALAFVILSFNDSIIAWSRFNYAGHMMCLVTQLSLMLVSLRRRNYPTKQPQLKASGKVK
nr:o acyltransferase (membrane bound) domain [Hymenolepis microstoma]